MTFLPGVLDFSAHSFFAGKILKLPNSHVIIMSVNCELVHLKLTIDTSVAEEERNSTEAEYN